MTNSFWGSFWGYFWGLLLGVRPGRRPTGRASVSGGVGRVQPTTTSTLTGVGLVSAS
jgi:hypothetical protein